MGDSMEELLISPGWFTILIYGALGLVAIGFVTLLTLLLYDRKNKKIW